MKKVFFSALCAIAFAASAFATPTPTVNEKVLRAFAQTFDSAHDVSWIEHRGIFEAHFTFNDIVTRVAYDKDGNALQTMRYYFERQLPLNILTKVKHSYKGQTIYGVTEVTEGDRTEYHIILENASSWTTVLADNSGYLSEEKKMSKA